MKTKNINALHCSISVRAENVPSEIVQNNLYASWRQAKYNLCLMTEDYEFNALLKYTATYILWNFLHRKFQNKYKNLRNRSYSSFSRLKLELGD